MSNPQWVSQRHWLLNVAILVQTGCLADKSPRYFSGNGIHYSLLAQTLTVACLSQGIMFINFQNERHDGLMAKKVLNS